MTAFARFDDLRPRRRRGFALTEVEEVIVATSPGQVRAALAEAEAAVGAGKWVGGWVAYEAAPAFDPALRVRNTRGTIFAGLPLAWFAVARRRRPAPAPPRASFRLEPWTALTPGQHHRDSVAEIKRLIRRGDTYQVNHTFMLASRLQGSTEAFYHALVRAQSCAYGAYVDSGDWVVASASPELFFEWRNGAITCRPMKGTARRGVDLDEDRRLREWLAASEKNRAENVMIVDMVRNDLGRVARVGSVRVPALFRTEKYDTVWQLTSTVTARTLPGVGLVDVFAALFPSASITGAPKVSTMEIISRLEPMPRGVYCGAIGFGGPGPEGPEWAFNVAIRTVVVERESGAAFYGTGGGITYDSDPADEYAEALLKAEVLTRPQGELGLIETTRWDPQLGARHLDRHLARAAASAEYFDIPFDPAEVRAALDRAVKERTEPALVRIVVDREGWVTVTVSEVPEPTVPVLALDDRPVDRTDPLLRHKTTLRRVYDEARARHPEADDVILWNEDFELTETTIGNLAFLIDGTWVTPPVRCGLLPGTERAARLASGELTEAVVTLSDLARVGEVARLNSVRGWEPTRVLSIETTR